MSACKMLHCPDKLRARGYCARHYSWAMSNGGIKSERRKGKDMYCSFPDCEKPHKGKGYCSGHLVQLQRGKQLAPLKSRAGLPKKFIPCSVEGCDRGHEAKGLCGLHYDRKLRTGSVELKPKFNFDDAIEDTEDLLSFGVSSREELVERAGWKSEDAMMTHLPEELKEKIRLAVHWD